MTIITTGHTPDKTPLVFADLFRIKIREGLPIDLLVKKVKDLGNEIDWNAEIEGALKIGLSKESILKWLKDAFKRLYPDMYLLHLEKAKWYLRLRPKSYYDQTIKSYSNDPANTATRHPRYH